MRLSIRRVLIAGIIGLQIVSVFAIVGSSYLRTEQVLIGHARQIMENVLANTIDHLKDFLEPAQLAADLTQKLAYHNVLRSDDSVGMERYLFEQLYLYGQFSGIYFGSTKGDFLYVKRDAEVVENGFRTKIIDRNEGQIETTLLWRNDHYQLVRESKDPEDRFDPRTRPWYEKAVKHEGVVWTEPYIFFSSQEPGITSASAVLDLHGERRGVVGVDIEIDDISHFLAKLRDQTNSSAFIFNSNGDVIAHPDPERITEAQDSNETGLGFAQIDAFDEPASRAAFLSLGQPAVSLDLEGPRFTTFDVDGDTYHAIFRPFPHGDWLWFIGVYIREDNFLGAIKANQVFNLGLAALIASIACLIGVFVARSISAPIGKLRQNAALIESGEPENLLPIKSHYVEVQETASAFEKMVSGLHKRDETNRALTQDLRQEVEVRRATEAALRESEQRFRDLVDATVDRYWQMDSELRFIRTADPSGTDFSPSADQTIGKTRWDLAKVEPGDEALWEAHQATLEAHKPFRDFRYRSRDDAGKIRHWRVSGKPIFDRHKVFQGYIGTATDETAELEARHRFEMALKEREERLRDLEAELLQATRLTTMSELSSSLAHELNQPLTAVGNYLSAVQRMVATAAEPVSEKVTETIDKAINQSRRAGDIIKGMRDLVERGETSQQLEDLNQTVEEASALAMRGRSGRGVNLDLQLGSDLPQVPMNRIQIQQVVVNLVRNSLDATSGRSQREIVLETRIAEDDQVEISVADNGVGLTAEVETKLFEPFVTTKGEGMGLGLSICRSIIDAHGGRIWVDSKTGVGTTFHFTLPSAQSG